jgi:hypothetical protein
LKALSFFLPVAVTVLGGAIACGGGSDATGPESRARRMTALTGDAQTGPTGATLPIPLAVLVLDIGDLPVVGATVGWKVVSGTAALSATSSKTDSTGTASTTVTLGSTIGAVAVRSTVGSVAPVTFNLSALDPCTFRAPYTIGSTITASLSTADCLQTIGNNQFYYDYYDFTTTTQLGLTAQMTSTSFDTWLDFWGGPDTSALDYVAFNNDIAGGNTNSFIQAIVAPGAYEIGANSNVPRATGPYSLITNIRPQTISGCQLIWVTRGISVDDSVTSADCKADFENNSTYGDAVAILLRGGTVVQIAEHSAALNAQLKLYRGDSLGLLPPVATNDDSATGTTNAYINYAVPTSNAFVIFIGSAVPLQTGSYNFTISASTTAAASRRRPEMLRFPPLLAHWPQPTARKN